MIKFLDEMTPDQQLAYRIGYQAGYTDAIQFRNKSASYSHPRDHDYYQSPGENEEAAQALCEAMADDWEGANLPGGLAPWYRRLVDVVLGANEVIGEDEEG